MAHPERVALVTTVPATLVFFQGQPTALRERGYEVHAIASPGSELDDFAAAEGIAAHPIPMSRLTTPFHDVVAFGRFVALFGRLRPAIVHASTLKCGLLSMFAARLTRRPVRIFHLHGLPHESRTGIRRAIIRRATQLTCLLANEVICVGPSVREVAIREGIVPRSKTVVLANGSANGVDTAGRFDPDRFGPNPRATARDRLGLPIDAPIVGYVGRLAVDKGISDLATAWRRLRATYPTAHLLIVGAVDPSFPVPDESLAPLRADERVHFTGRRPDPELAMLAMDVLALPTYREGLPTVLIEANGMGTPVVATDVTGCADAILAGETGFLVPPHAPDDLAAAIGRYFDDPELRDRHGAAGRVRVQRDFDPAGIRLATAEFYDRALLGRGRHPPITPLGRNR